MKKTKEISIITLLSYLFLALPVVLFVIGWCRWYISIPVSIIIFVSIFLAMRDAPEQEWKPEWNRDTVLRILLILAVIIVWVITAGIGRGVFQNTDQFTRNSLYEILVNNKWPVTNVINIGEDTEARLLVYYIGFWLPSAVIGKIAGIQAGYLFQIVWSVIGVFCMYYMICRWRKKIVIWPLFVFIFFSGLDVVGTFFFRETENLLRGVDHLEWWSGFYQYSSITTQLFWVFNQAIPCWLAVMLLWMQKNSRNVVFIISMVMLTSTLPFIGLLPIAVYIAVTRIDKADKEECLTVTDKATKFLKRVWKEIVTFQNFVGGGCIGILSFLYLKLNFSGSVIANTATNAVSNPATNETANNAVNHIVNNVIASSDGIINLPPPQWGIQIIAYVAFIFLEVGVYFICLYQKEKNNALYYLELLSLLIIPFIKIGYSIDFCMRASIPALFILILMIIDFLDNNSKSTMKNVLMILLLVGSVTAIHEMHRTLITTATNDYEIYVLEPESVFAQPNFSGKVQNSIFCDYIMKK